MILSELLKKIDVALFVSCQANPGEVFHEPDSMRRFALAAIAGGAAGIRANGADDIAAIRSAVSVPIVGISKQILHDGHTLICS